MVDTWDMVITKFEQDRNLLCHPLCWKCSLYSNVCSWKSFFVLYNSLQKNGQMMPLTSKYDLCIIQLWGKWNSEIWAIEISGVAHLWWKCIRLYSKFKCPLNHCYWLKNGGIKEKLKKKKSIICFHTEDSISKKKKSDWKNKESRILPDSIDVTKNIHYVYLNQFQSPKYDVMTWSRCDLGNSVCW